MSHFAKIDTNNVVTEVIVSEQNFINSGIQRMWKNIHQKKRQTILKEQNLW